MLKNVFILLVSLIVLTVPALAADVSICGTITESSTLTADITNNASEKCFIITTSDITFDCDGYTVDGNDNLGAPYEETFGFHVTDSTNVTIKNCIISDFTNGLYFSGETNSDHIISNNTLESNSYGIYLNTLTNGIVNNTTVVSNTNTGVVLSSCSGMSLYHNNFTSNTVQVSDSDPSNNDWHNTTLLQGNWWSDYIGVDDGRSGRTAGDGVGDSLIPHPTTNYDNYPLTSVTEVTYFETSSCMVIVNDTKLTADIINTNPSTMPTFVGVTGSKQAIPCFFVNISNIILDCQGYTIDGTDNQSYEYYGIYLDNVSGVSLRNCSISDFTVGLFLNYSSSNVIENVTSNSNNGWTYVPGPEEEYFDDAGYGIYNTVGCFYNNFTTITANSNTRAGIVGGNNNITSSIFRSSQLSSGISGNGNTVTNSVFCYNNAITGAPSYSNNIFCVNQTTPVNGTSSSNTTYSFYANISNKITSGINCTLNIGSDTVTNTTVTNNKLTTFSKTFTVGGDFIWNVSCSDSNDNTGITPNWLLTVSGITGASCSSGSDCVSSYCVHNVCRVNNYYCGDGWCDSGESCGNCEEDCGSCGGDLVVVEDDDEDEDEDLDELTGKFEEIIDSIKKGQEFEIDVSDLGSEALRTKVKLIRIIPGEDAQKAEILVNGYSVAPPEIKTTLTEEGRIEAEENTYSVYQYIEITSEIEVESADIEFEITNQWMLDNGVKSDEVTLLHYKDKWIELKTELLSKDALNSYFTAKTDSFSMFAIGVKSQTILIESNTSIVDTLINVIYVLAISIVILLVLILLNKKKGVR